MRQFKYYSTKTYGHEEGLSCMFRQPLATHSHCSLLHGYALSFSFKFGCENLDDKNWVVDFGDLKELKAWLKDSYRKLQMALVVVSFSRIRVGLAI